MNSGDLLAMVNQAIREKEKAHKSYEDYYEKMNNPTLRKVVEGVLQREAEHLEILNSLKESVGNKGNLDQVAALSAERLINNTAGNREQLEMMKMVLQEMGGIMSEGDSAELMGHDLEAAEIPVDDPMPTVASQSPRSGRAVNYSNYGYKNRSVISCSFNSPKSVNKR